MKRICLLTSLLLLLVGCSNRQNVQSPDGIVQIAFQNAMHGIPMYKVE